MSAPAFLILYCLFPVSHFWAESLALSVQSARADGKISWVARDRPQPAAESAARGTQATKSAPSTAAAAPECPYVGKFVSARSRTEPVRAARPPWPAARQP